MIKQVSATGGAHFIGLRPAGELLRNGYPVRVLDNLSEQEREGRRRWPGGIMYRLAEASGAVACDGLAA